MTDQKDASPVFLQSFLQRIFCINIQMVCRFIQQKKIRISVQKLAHAYLCLLATTQDPDLTFYVLCRQSTFCQCRADFILGTGRKLLPQLLLLPVQSNRSPDYLQVHSSLPVPGSAPGYFSAMSSSRFRSFQPVRPSVLVP